MNKQIYLLIITMIFLTFFSSAEASDQRTVKRKQNAGARFALVIGNGNYADGRLKNPPNDAADMSRALKQLGFQVETLTNAGQRKMEDAIKDFGRRLKSGSVGLFYYAGHGIQADNRNYLIPVDARIEKESDIKYAAMDAGRVLDEMEEARNGLNIVLLDACRDNPFARNWQRSGQKGLAQMYSPTGTLITYATSPGKTSADGDGRNGTFTKYLLRHMTEPGLKIEDLIKKVRIDVARETGNRQIPWNHSSLMGDFYFADSSGTTVVTPPKPEPSKITPPKDGKLTVKAEGVSNAMVWVNGKKYQNAPMTFTISQAGKYEIKVTADGYEPYTKTENIELGAEVEVTAYLKKIEVPVKPVEVTPVVQPSQKQKITNSLGMTFVYIEPGTFMMGSPENEPGRYNTEKQHKVKLTKGFYMQTTEVTQGQWKAVMGNNPSYFKKCGENCPVEQVSWDDVQKFIKKLNRMEKTAQYRLPTEAEWEYAARAGAKTPFAFGNCLSTDKANYCGNYSLKGCSKGKYRKKTVPADSFSPNAWGLYNMHGNVREWCRDWYGDYPSGAVTDPQGPSSGSNRVGRGGSWNDLARHCRSAAHGYSSPVNRGINLGFRLLRMP